MGFWCSWWQQGSHTGPSGRVMRTDRVRPHIVQRSLVAGLACRWGRCLDRHDEQIGRPVGTPLSQGFVSPQMVHSAFGGV